MPNLRLESKNHTRGMTKLAQIDSLWPKRLKTIPYGTAHTYLADMRECTLPPRVAL